MSEPCPHAETQEIINETRKVLKKGLLKARILSSTWSLAIVLLVQNSMSLNPNISLAAVAMYVLWAGEALWEIKRIK